MIKNTLRTASQKLFGFERYLFVFSLINIVRIKYCRADPEFVFFLNTIKEKGAILDIGANIGFTTVLLAQKFPMSNIYAFEPVPENIRAMEKVIRYFHLKNIMVITTALGNEEGKVTMQIPTVNNAKMQGLSHVIENPIYGSEVEKIIVQIQKLDQTNILQEEQSISAIKIDVENFEYFVLQGGKALISKHRPILFCELWDNERRLLCFELMKELGYQIKIWQKDKLVEFTGQTSLNFFFLPET